MAEKDDLLQKADALMQRHRVFVAGATAGQPDGKAAQADDVPVLTEVISPDALTETLAATPPSVDLGELRNALAFQLETWLDEELPDHILRMLDGMSDQLIVQLSLKARAELLPRLQKVLDARQPDAAED